MTAQPSPVIIEAERTRVTRLLSHLGDTPDQVAFSLLALGHCGARGIGQACPVFRFLQSQSVDVQTVGSSGVWIDTYTEVSTPPVVRDFIQAFDQGRYPRLVSA